MEKIIIDILEKLFNGETITYSDSDGGINPPELTAMDTCKKCGYTGDEFDNCPKCGAHHTEDYKSE